MSPPRFHRRGAPSRGLGLLVVALVALSACTAPSRQELDTAQALNELGEAFSDVRLVQQELQDQIDSLRFVVARQDSIMRTLANLAGVPVPRR